MQLTAAARTRLILREHLDVINAAVCMRAVPEVASVRRAVVAIAVRSRGGVTSQHADASITAAQFRLFFEEVGIQLCCVQ